MHRGAPTYGRPLTLNTRAAFTAGPVDKSPLPNPANLAGRESAADKSRAISPPPSIRAKPAIAGRTVRATF
jgi:hypothetical protein